MGAIEDLGAAWDPVAGTVESEEISAKKHQEIGRKASAWMPLTVLCNLSACKGSGHVCCLFLNQDVCIKMHHLESMRWLLGAMALFITKFKFSFFCVMPV
jgi:hypothetical protein